MTIDTIKSNINKIDYELKNLFESVNTSEKYEGNRFFFAIEAKTDILFESGNKKIDVIAEIDSNMSDKIKWRYLSNPLDRNSDKIERTSTLDTISKDIYEVATKKRMINEYFNSINYEMINENNSNTNNKEISEQLSDIVSKYTKINKIDSSKNIILESNQFMSKKPDTNISISYIDEMKISDKFKLESDIKKINGIKQVTFKENKINISYNSIVEHIINMESITKKLIESFFAGYTNIKIVEIPNFINDGNEVKLMIESIGKFIKGERKNFIYDVLSGKLSNYNIYVEETPKGTEVLIKK